MAMQNLNKKSTISLHLYRSLTADFIRTPNTAPKFFPNKASEKLHLGIKINEFILFCSRFFVTLPEVIQLIKI